MLRRDCVGDPIQIDGGEHRWFEGCGPMCTLLAYIDDATSRMMHPCFVETESTFADPTAFYSDLQWRTLIIMGKYS